MGKTFKRNSQFRPKKAGRVFDKNEKKWKKHKPKDNRIGLLPYSNETTSSAEIPDYT